MGLFLNSDFSKTTTTTTSTANNPLIGNVNYNQYGNFNIDTLMQSFPSIFMWGIEQFGGDDSSDDDGTSAKLEAKNDALKAVFTEASTPAYTTKITNMEQLEQALDNVKNPSVTKYLNSNIQNISTELTTLQQSVAGSESSSSLKIELEKIYSDFPTCNTVKDGQTANPELVEKYKKAIDTETKLIPEKQKQLNDAKKAEEVRLTALKGQAENLQNEINGIKRSIGTEGVKFNVEQETNDIKTFMTALKAFQNSPSQSTFDALTEALEKGDAKNGKDGVQQLSVRKAYDLVVKQYPDFANKKA